MNSLVQLIQECNFPVTAFLLALIIISSTYCFISQAWFYRMTLHPYSIVYKKQYWRLLSADLVHNDWVHLVFNCATFYVFGAGLEEELRKISTSGSLHFMLIYVASLLTGTFISTIRHRKDFTYSSAGVSGSITGCMFSFFMIDPNLQSLQIPGIGAVKNIYTGVFYILALIVYQKRREQPINYEIHFFGAIGGILATLVLFPNIL